MPQLIHRVQPPAPESVLQLVPDNRADDELSVGESGSRLAAENGAVIDKALAAIARGEDLTSAQAERGAAGQISDGPGLSRAVIERLACNESIRTIVHGTDRDKPERKNVLDVGRSHRTVTRKQYRALLIRDHGHCSFPGCVSRHGLDAHHVQHWLPGGRTDMGNLLLLCQTHHTAHHNGVFTITAHRGQRFRFTRPDGHQLPTTIDPTVLTQASQQVEDQQHHVSATAATTRWDGQRLDRGYAIHVLATRRQRTA